MNAGIRKNLLGAAAILFLVAACSTNTTTTTTAPGGSTPAETPSETPSDTPADEGSAEPTAPTVVRVVADGKGYTPETIKVKLGTPTVVEFVLKTEETCARDLVIPDLDIEKRLDVNKPLKVEVPSDKARTYDFECSMQMYKGTIVVE